MNLTMNSELETFARRFLTGRMNWRKVPRDGITYFGVILSMILYRKGQFQVELVISPHDNASFTRHRHPNVDAIEFPLAGDSWLLLNDQYMWTEEQLEEWLKGESPSPLIPIGHDDWHSGGGKTAYAFLSIQYWLNDVTPKNSVGLDWEGEYSGETHQQLVESGMYDR